MTPPWSSVAAGTREPALPASITEVCLRELSRPEVHAASPVKASAAVLQNRRLPRAFLILCVMRRSSLIEVGGRAGDTSRKRWILILADDAQDKHLEGRRRG